MGAGDQRLAPMVGPVQRQPKHRDDQPHAGPGERRQHGEDQQAAVPLGRRRRDRPAVGSSERRCYGANPVAAARKKARLVFPASRRQRPFYRRPVKRYCGAGQISRKGLAMTAPSAHRPTIAVTRHAISAGHYLAATAGFAILEAGGNAIDAGCAAGIALGVLQSDLVDVAGVAPIMIYDAEEPRGRDHRRARPLAEGARPRTVHARARRQDPEGCVAHRRPGRTRRLDHRTPALGHDELWRGRGGGDPARPRRLSDVPADGRRA